YPNLDFGWKKSIDSKSFISCPSTCMEDDDDHCKHGTSSDSDHTAQEGCNTEASQPPEGALPCENCNTPDEKLETHVLPVTDLQTPNKDESDCVCSQNLPNGTRGDSDDLPHRHDICQCSQLGPLESDLSTQTTTSVPVRPSPAGEPQPQPSDECTPGRNSDLCDGHVKKPTSNCCPKPEPATSTTAPSEVSSEVSDVTSTSICTGPAWDSPKTLGPNPGLILQALTLSNASDGFNLERLEMLGDSFLKHAITTYLFCTYPDAHEGRLSYMRSKK
ncbi:hypothetical protein M9458_033836, partial [Cirrhinus mrigala]